MSRYLRHSYGWLWRQTPLQTLRAIEPHSSFLPCALTSRLRLVPTPTIPFSQTPGRGVGGFAQDSEGVDVDSLFSNHLSEELEPL